MTDSEQYLTIKEFCSHLRSDKEVLLPALRMSDHHGLHGLLKGMWPSPGGLVEVRLSASCSAPGATRAQRHLGCCALTGPVCPLVPESFPVLHQGWRTCCAPRRHKNFLLVAHRVLCAGKIVADITCHDCTIHCDTDNEKLCWDTLLIS